MNKELNNFERMYIYNQGYNAYFNDMFRCFSKTENEHRKAWHEGYREAQRIDSQRKTYNAQQIA